MMEMNIFEPLDYRHKTVMSQISCSPERAELLNTLTPEQGVNFDRAVREFAALNNWAMDAEQYAALAFSRAFGLASGMDQQDLTLTLEH